jgi:hypothetical protein
MTPAIILAAREMARRRVHVRKLSGRRFVTCGSKTKGACTKARVTKKGIETILRKLLADFDKVEAHAVVVGDADSISCGFEGDAEALFDLVEELLKNVADRLEKLGAPRMEKRRQKVAVNHALRKRVNKIARRLERESA